jgi:hypothetical protein
MPPPKTRSPGSYLDVGGQDMIVPANSSPSVKGGTTRVRLFWCFPLA